MLLQPRNRDFSWRWRVQPYSILLVLHPQAPGAVCIRLPLCSASYSSDLQSFFLIPPPLRSFSLPHFTFPFSWTLPTTHPTPYQEFPHSSHTISHPSLSGADPSPHGMTLFHQRDSLDYTIMFWGRKATATCMWKPHMGIELYLLAQK